MNLANNTNLSKRKEHVSVVADNLHSFNQHAVERLEVGDTTSTVIRVRRKRLQEPPTALLVACKKRKYDDENAKENNEIEENLFRFATTVKSGDTHEKVLLQEKVNDAIHLHDQVKTLYKDRKRNAFDGHSHTSPKKKHTGASKQLSAMLQAHYKSLEKQCHPDASPDHHICTSSTSASPLPKKGGHSSQCNSKEKSNASSSCGDIAEPVTQPRSSNDEDIYCNSIKMLREKLEISKPDEDDYVYDLYYCKKPEAVNDDDILYFKPCSILDFEETSRDFDVVARYGDEDDSNDESNWRNDYPDEEDSDDDNNRGIASDEDEEFYGSDSCKHHDSYRQLSYLAVSRYDDDLHTFDDYVDDSEYVDANDSFDEF